MDYEEKGLENNAVIQLPVKCMDRNCIYALGSLMLTCDVSTYFRLLPRIHMEEDCCSTVGLTRSVVLAVPRIVKKSASHRIT